MRVDPARFVNKVAHVGVGLDDRLRQRRSERFEEGRNAHSPGNGVVALSTDGD